MQGKVPLIESYLPVEVLTTGPLVAGRFRGQTNCVQSCSLVPPGNIASREPLASYLLLQQVRLPLNSSCLTFVALMWSIQLLYPLT